MQSQCASQPESTSQTQCTSQRSARADRAQDSFDQLVLVAAATAVLGVALQTFVESGPLLVLGVIAATISWLIFAADTSVMLRVSPNPGRWARGHALELLLLVTTLPLWGLLREDLLLLELLPALTVFEAAKLAKLAKVAFAVRGRRGQAGQGKIAAIALVAAAAALAISIVWI